MNVRSKLKGSRTIISLWIFFGLMIAMVLGVSVRTTQASAQANTVTTATHLPILRDVFNPNTREAVHVKDAEAVFRVTFDAAGGNIVEVQCTMSGTGRGVNSGNGYQLIAGGRSGFNASRPPVPEFQLLCNGHLIAPRSNDPLPVMIALSVAVDAEGRVTATVRDAKRQAQ
jgi:hypothetical protein